MKKIILTGVLLLSIFVGTVSAIGQCKALLNCGYTAVVVGNQMSLYYEGRLLHTFECEEGNGHWEIVNVCKKDPAMMQ